MSRAPLLKHKVYFIRHGETDWNAEGRLQGQRDIPLNDVGRIQAEEAGARLRAIAPRYENLAYFASPMTRTRETMERMRAAIFLHPPYYKTDERLKELTFGSWEGFTWREIRQKFPDAARMRERDKWSFVPPDGESYAMLAARVKPFFDGLDREAVIVSHGGVARVMLTMYGGVSHVDAPLEDIWQDKVMVFESETWRWA